MLSAPVTVLILSVITSRFTAWMVDSPVAAHDDDDVTAAGVC